MLRGLQSLLLTAKRREKKKKIWFFNNILMFPDHEISFYCLPFPPYLISSFLFHRILKSVLFFCIQRKRKKRKGHTALHHLSHFQFCFFVCGAVGGNYVLEWHSLNFVKQLLFIMLIGSIWKISYFKCLRFSSISKIKSFGFSLFP